MQSDTDIAIIGAGPYGLSVAAYLNAQRISTRVFGKPMGFWLDHMPKGMHLKSDGFASNLYDPKRSYTLKHFCRDHRLSYDDASIPVALETFCRYGLAFQKRFVPNLREDAVIDVIDKPDGFALTLENNDVVTARRVVVAVGIYSFRNIPTTFQHLGSEFVSHSADHHDLSSFAGRHVVILGAGASAIDIAALLHEANASVTLVAREKAVRFHSGGAAKQRSLWKRLRHPSSGIGPGLRARFYCDAPWLFHRFPEDLRLFLVKRTLGPAGGWFMKERFINNIPTILGFAPEAIKVVNGRIHLEIRALNGSIRQLVTDHVIAATGYKVDIQRLDFLSSRIRSKIKTVENTPILSSSMETSVRGLYFVGAAAANSFGPVMRFAFGAGFTAPHLTEAFVKSL